MWRRLMAIGMAIMVLIAARLQAQKRTIPEKAAFAQAHHAAPRGPAPNPSGVPPTIQQVLQVTNVVVECTIGIGRSYLSTDQTEIYTDYPIHDPVFYYQTGPFTAPGPGQQEQLTTVTRWGGTVTVSGFKWVEEVKGFAPLPSGQRMLLLLQRDSNGKYLIVDRWYGAFGISDGQVMPWMRDKGFAPEYRGKRIADAIASMLAIIHQQ